MPRSTVSRFALLALALLLSGCRPEISSSDQKVTYGTHLVLLESGIHWAEWIKADNTPCGDVYKWDNIWIADTYHPNLEQHPFDTKDEAIAYIQRWCK